MANKMTFEYYTADFETTVFEGQTFTEVWLAGFCKFFTEDCHIQYSIYDFMSSVFRTPENMIIFLHNLKFDGSFILDWLKRQKDFKEVTYKDDSGEHFIESYKLHNKEYIYQISSKGVFYSITIKYRKHLYTFYDSLKILPFSVKQIGESFHTKHKKLSMEYEGFRESGQPEKVTQEELKYFKNDLYVPKEGLEYMFNQGFTKQTIGSNCLAYFKDIFDIELFDAYFPNLYEVEFNHAKFEEKNIGEIIHKSYHGAWCYVNEKIKDKIQFDGFTVDANSLYSSQMHSKSGNKYPYGKPQFFEEIQPFKKNAFQFIRFKCRFELKKDFFPFIQKKGDIRYNSREMLKSNIVYSKIGEIVENPLLEFTMTEIDYVLFFEHYNIFDFELIGVFQFRAQKGLFDEYIDFFMEKKINAKNKAERTLAKLFLNNLYGRFAMYHDSSFKKCYLSDDYILSFDTVEEHKKKPAYIPVGSAITAYARNETIRKAQINKDIFCYADTDSLHCTGSFDNLQNVPIDDSALCCWKIERSWYRGIFHRTKSYIETVQENGHEEYYITCAGMGNNCKTIFSDSLKYRDGTLTDEEITKNPLYDKKDIEYIKQGHNLEDFKTGLLVPKNLKAKRIVGGIILEEKEFKLRG